MWRWLVVSVALLALLASGCAQAAQKAVEQTTGVKTEQQGESVTISSKEGTAVTISSNTPDELKDFPVPDGFKSDGSGTMASGEDKLIAASWKGKGDVKAIAAFYKKAMADKGWEETFSMDTEDGGMRNYSKGDYGATITIDKSSDSDEVTISLLMGKGKKTPTPEATATEEPTPTEEPEATPTKGPTSTPAPPASADPSAMAPELKDVPVPSGFTLMKDALMRFEEGGKFKGASAMWFGQASIKEVAKFYKDSMEGKGWTETEWMEMEDVVVGAYTSASDESLKLTVSVGKSDSGAGTQIIWMLQKE